MKKKLFVLISFVFSLCTTAVAQITPPTLDTPSDGTVYISTATPTLYCNAKSGAVRYIFQWDTVATFDSPLLSTHSSSYKGYTAQDLKFNTQYYWRAAVTSNNGDTSAWSAVRTFTTMVQPSLDTPLDNAVYTSTATPTLDCNITTGVGRYIFQWDTVATFDSPLLSTHSSSYKGYTAQDLKFNTQYYWRAAVTNGDNSDTSAWSAVRTFTTMVRPSLDTPLDSAVYISNATPTLYCNITTGVERYIFQWDTVATFDSPLLSTHSSSYKGYTAQDLKFNTQYYWRAAVTSNNGDTSAWSAVRTFTTMVRPSLDTPLDSAVYTSTATPTLDCNITTGVGRYIFQWDTVATFDSPLLSTHSSSYKGYTAQDLKFNTQYYWRAAVTNGDNSDTSAWSAVRTFTTMVRPSLDTPLDSAVYISNATPTLYCNITTGVERYIFQWDTVATFDSPLLSTHSSSYKGYTAQDLKFNTQYYWRAAVTNGDNSDTSAWSVVRTFTTMVRPSLDTPLDSAVYISNATPTLYCNITTGVERYIFQWDTVATFDSPLLSTHSSSYKGYTAQDLKFNTQYYWRAAVTNNNGDTSAWSVVRTFTTMVRPSLDTPLDSAVYISNATPTLYCNITTGVERYIFQWDTVATFDSPLLSTHSSSYKGYTAQDLKFNTQYYWRAAVTNNNGDTSAWSVVRTFTTMSAPTLSSPTNGAYNISLNPTLSCNTISNVTHYIFEWDTVPTFNSPAYNTYRSSYRSITANNLLTANYYWRAAVTNNNGDTSLWSEVWQFSTRPAPVTSEFSATVCDSYVWNGHSYNTSGDYTQTLRAQNQADSIVTLHLTVNVSKDTLINITIYDREIPYDWHGQQITETGEYTWLGTTAEGCDSLVVADIFVMVVDNLDYTEENLFTITPNPVKRGETVLIDAEVGEPFIVEVYASDSRLLQRISAADSPFRLTMPTTNGLYLLRLVTASGRFLYSKVLVR